MMDSPQVLPLTKLVSKSTIQFQNRHKPITNNSVHRQLLLNVPEHHQNKYSQAIEVLDRCASALNEAAVSKEVQNSINTEEIKLKELQADVARMRIFLKLVQESCFDIINGADSSIKPEVKVKRHTFSESNNTSLIDIFVQALMETLALSKLGAKSGRLMELMGIPAALNNSVNLSPHTKHVLQIVMANKIRAQTTSSHKRC